MLISDPEAKPKQITARPAAASPAAVAFSSRGWLLLIPLLRLLPLLLLRLGLLTGNEDQIARDLAAESKRLRARE